MDPFKLAGPVSNPTPLTTPSYKVPRARRVLLLGATGTIGRATARALVEQGLRVTAIVRPATAGAVADDPSLADLARHFDFVIRPADVTDVASFARDGLRGEPFDALVSCLASRTGVPTDAWAIDHRAHVIALTAARAAGVTQMVLLSAICVQKPLLAFQQAKLAFEAELVASGVTYSIVRPTAFFKSLSGQVARVQAGKPFLVFGDGRLTACKPVSDRDLAEFIAGCLDDPDRQNRILPIGGPGPAITPREQAEMLFRLLGRAPRIRQVPVAMLDTIVSGLSLAGRFSSRLAAKAELARIGRYYATESMLVLDPVTGRYLAEATPATGRDTLEGHYRRLIAGDVADDLGAHAVF